MPYDAWHCVKHITIQDSAAGALQGILGCVLQAIGYLQSEKPRGDLVSPDNISVKGEYLTDKAIV